MLDELLEVLRRTKFAERLAAAVPPLSPASLVQRYAALATIVTPEPIVRAVPTDADDDQVIVTALAAGAGLIVTGDSDLLALDPDNGIRILRSAEALDNLRGVSSD